MGAGRPTKYLPEYCEQLIEHMDSGLSFESFAGKIGVSKRVLYDWEKEYPEFLHAKEIGTEKSRIFWENLGINHIVNKTDSEFQGGSKSRSLNSSAWIFNMKNRFGWRDKQPGEEDRTIKHEYSNKSDDELDQELEAMESGED
jgi:DNA-binding XRE family transcriptional regulator